jgi:hypothetical protein
VLLLFYYVASGLVAEGGNLALERSLYAKELIGE